MKAVACLAPGQLSLIDRPEPALPGTGEALVAVAHVGICGTDYHIFEGKHPYLAYPRVMGHEVSGTVVAVGDGVAVSPGTEVIVNPYIACGICIACRQGKPNCCVTISVLGVHRDGAMCGHILVPAANLYPTDGLPLRLAAAVEFLAIGAHAVRRSLAGPGTPALVIGAGPIGLGTAIFAQIAGQNVVLTDTSQARLEMAASGLGFAVAEPEKTSGDAFGVVYDATGNAASMQAAFGRVAHGGALVLVSVVTADITFSDPEFHKREMMLVGSRNALAEDFSHVAGAIKAGLVPMDRIFTHRTTLADAPRDIARWATDKTGLIKAVIDI